MNQEGRKTGIDLAVTQLREAGLSSHETRKWKLSRKGGDEIKERRFESPAVGSHPLRESPASLCVCEAALRSRGGGLT